MSSGCQPRVRTAIRVSTSRCRAFLASRLLRPPLCPSRQAPKARCPPTTSSLIQGMPHRLFLFFSNGIYHDGVCGEVENGYLRFSSAFVTNNSAWGRTLPRVCIHVGVNHQILDGW